MSKKVERFELAAIATVLPFASVVTEGAAEVLLVVEEAGVAVGVASLTTPVSEKTGESSSVVELLLDGLAKLEPYADALADPEAMPDPDASELLSADATEDDAEA